MRNVDIFSLSLALSGTIVGDLLNDKAINKVKRMSSECPFLRSERTI